MEINRNAPATAEGELQIDADPQTVFSVISAIYQWPSWNSNVKSVTLQGPGPASHGVPVEVGAEHPHLLPPGARPAPRDRLDRHDPRPWW